MGFPKETRNTSIDWISYQPTDFFKPSIFAVNCYQKLHLGIYASFHYRMPLQKSLYLSNVSTRCKSDLSERKLIYVARGTFTETTPIVHLSQKTQRGQWENIFVSFSTLAVTSWQQLITQGVISSLNLLKAFRVIDFRRTCKCGPPRQIDT